MGLDIFELIFLWIGKKICKIFSKDRSSERSLSDGANEVIGFFAVLFVVLIAFLTWGALNV